MVYQAMWEPHIGELFLTIHEGSNIHESHAMMIYRHEHPGMIVGHTFGGSFTKKSVNFHCLGQGPALTVCISAVFIEVPNTMWIRDYNSKYLGIPLPKLDVIFLIQ